MTWLDEDDGEQPKYTARRIIWLGTKDFTSLLIRSVFPAVFLFFAHQRLAEGDTILASYLLAVGLVLAAKTASSAQAGQLMRGVEWMWPNIKREINKFQARGVLVTESLFSRRDLPLREGISPEPLTMEAVEFSLWNLRLQERQEERTRKEAK